MLSQESYGVLQHKCTICQETYSNRDKLVKYESPHYRMYHHVIKNHSEEKPKLALACHKNCRNLVSESD